MIKYLPIWKEVNYKDYLKYESKNFKVKKELIIKKGQEGIFNLIRLYEDKCYTSKIENYKYYYASHEKPYIDNSNIMMSISNKTIRELLKNVKTRKIDRNKIKFEREFIQDLKKIFNL